MGPDSAMNAQAVLARGILINGVPTEVVYAVGKDGFVYALE